MTVLFIEINHMNFLSTQKIFNSHTGSKITLDTKIHMDHNKIHILCKQNDEIIAKSSLTFMFSPLNFDCDLLSLPG